MTPVATFQGRSRPRRPLTTPRRWVVTALTAVALAIGGLGYTPATAATEAPVERLWGETAIGTAAGLSDDAFGQGATTVYVATVSGYWDALSGGAAAARQGGPMLLTEPDALPVETRDELLRLKPATIVIQGGLLAVSARVETALAAYAPTVVRNAGDTAIGTAVLTSQRAFPDGAASVFVATAASFYDALSGGTAAGRNGAPVLLVEPTGTVDPRVLSEITRLGVQTAYLLGGPLALPEAIEEQLESAGVPVTRLAGESALDTSLAINRATVSGSDEVYLVTQSDYYDGLAAGPAATMKHGIVVLTNGACLSSDAKAYVLSLKPARIVIVGGTLAMSAQFDTLTGCVPAIDVASLAGGSEHTCALTVGGAVWCWGSGIDGQLGDGTDSGKTRPVAVPELTSGVTAIAARSRVSCAVTDAGAVRCWGNNLEKMVGTDGGTAFSPGWSGIRNGATAVALGSTHTCALMTDGGVQCWGNNEYGQLGDGGTTYRRSTPVSVMGLSGKVTSLALGFGYSCALTSDAAVQCWGTNTHGQLGDGTTIDRLTPVTVSGLGSGVTALTSGGGHACAVLATGGVRCWGHNISGQIGDDTTVDRSTPVAVVGLDAGVTAISAGDRHTCALRATGPAVCWGSNNGGQLGDYTTVARTHPVPLAGADWGYVAVAAGGSHTCGVTRGGDARCWGNNASGQLGDGTRASSTYSGPVLF